MLRRLIISFSMLAMFGVTALAQRGGPPQPPKPEEEEKPPAMSVPQNYRFETKGRRDPFVNPVPKPVEPPPTIALKRPDGLKGVLLSEATVSAVVVSREAPELTRAMIKTAGGRMYFASQGDALFDATVKEIRGDAVVFELTSKNRDGRTTTQEVVRKLRP